jgi:hypothetical protein
MKLNKNFIKIILFKYKWAILIIILLIIFVYINTVKENMTDYINEKSRIIVSLTTIPERIEKKTIDKTLNSLSNQIMKPYIIYINVPKISNNNKKYPIDELETIVNKYTNLNIKINIVEKDLGPITKVIPILPFIKDTDSVILVDDDMDYIPEMISQLINSNEKAVGYAGRLTGLEYRTSDNYYGPVEFLETFAGVLYSGKLLNGLDKFYNSLNKICINQDDIVIGKFLNSKNVFPKIAPNLQNPGTHDANGTPELRTDNLSSGNEKCYNYLLKL